MSTRILGGHCIDVLNREPADHYHLVVTSPPYIWLRAYNTEPQVWANPDGTPLCGNGAHEWDEYRQYVEGGGNAISSAEAFSEPGAANADRIKAARWKTGATCARCGAWRGELGSEPTPELFIAHLVAVFEAVRRVLRPDGTLWVNLAGSYVSNPGGQNGSTGGVSERAQTAARQNGRQDRTSRLEPGGWLKPLDYLDVPGLFAHAMQRAGWYWRADIALVKKAPMPESVQGWRFERCRVKVASSRRATDSYKAHSSDGVNNAHGAVKIVPGANGSVFDSRSEWADCPGCRRCEPNDGLVLRRGNGRPTRAWERFLVFAKQLPAYWDTEAVREPNTEGAIARFGNNNHRSLPTKYAGLDGISTAAAGARMDEWRGDGHNLRNWLYWPTRGAALQEQHYAAYPPDLAALAVKAGTSERCCAVCGAPWARVVETVHGGPTARADRLAHGGRWYPASEAFGGGVPTGTTGGSDTRGMPSTTSTTTGWRPTCGHPAAAWVPAKVLDPFGGSGSTAIAADRLGRNCTLIDLNPSYTQIAVRRVTQDAPLFADVTLG